MSNEHNQKTPHPLSIIAAEVVRHMQDRPGTWDFEEAFRPHIERLRLEERIAENKMAQDAASAHVGKQLYLFHRGLELQKAMQALEEKQKQP